MTHTTQGAIVPNPSTDSQRQRVYDAEQSSGLQRRHGDRTLTMTECEDLIDRALSRKSIQKHYSDAECLRRRVAVARTHGGGRAGWDDEIRLGVWARQEIVVLHELAHLLAGNENAHHWQFTQALLRLVSAMMGREAHDALRDAYKKHKVRYTPKRRGKPLSPEQRAINTERLAVARAAKQAKREIEQPVVEQPVVQHSMPTDQPDVSTTKLDRLSATRMFKIGDRVWVDAAAFAPATSLYDRPVPCTIVSIDRVSERRGKFTRFDVVVRTEGELRATLSSTQQMMQRND